VTLQIGAVLNPGGDPNVPATKNQGTLTALRSVFLNGGTNSSWIVGIGNATGPNAANLLNLSNAAGILNIVTTSGNYNIDFEAVGTPPFTLFTPVSYTIASVTTAGNIQQNGGAFGNGTTGFTFTSSSIQFQNPSLSVSSGNLRLTFTPVPEPAHALLLCSAAAGAAGWWRRRRS
jgi:hypothetical protein